MSEPFCPDPRSRQEFDRIARLVREAGYDVDESDGYLLGAFANAAARLQHLAEQVSEEKDADRRLRLMSAERLARGDMARLIDQLERHYAGVEVEASAPELRRTGTGGNVVEFSPVRSKVEQRVLSVLSRSPEALTRDELAAKVSGSKGALLDALRELVRSGAVKKTGAGRRGSPHRYGRA
jgi:hypothetical protein